MLCPCFDSSCVVLPMRPSQVSYGMTECCGKISMSIQDFDWTQDLQQRLLEVQDPGEVAAAEAAFYDGMLQRICTSGRPFLLMEVRAGHTAQPACFEVHTSTQHTEMHHSPTGQTPQRCSKASHAHCEVTGCALLGHWVIQDLQCIDEAGQTSTVLSAADCFVVRRRLRKQLLTW